MLNMVKFENKYGRSLAPKGFVGWFCHGQIQGAGFGLRPFCVYMTYYFDQLSLD